MTDLKIVYWEVCKALLMDYKRMLCMLTCAIILGTIAAVIAMYLLRNGQ